MIVIMIQNANKDKPMYKYWKNLSGCSCIIMKLIEGSSVLKIIALGVAEQVGYGERDAEHVGEGLLEGEGEGLFDGEGEGLLDGDGDGDIDGEGEGDLEGNGLLGGRIHRTLINSLGLIMKSSSSTS